MNNLKNELEKMYTQANKNINFIIREFQQWHLDTYYRKAQIDALAVLIGLTKQSLYHSINNTREASSEKLFRIAIIFDINLDILCKIDIESSEERRVELVKSFEVIGCLYRTDEVERGCN